jgi:hypothetical protein
MAADSTSVPPASTPTKRSRGRPRKATHLPDGTANLSRGQRRAVDAEVKYLVDPMAAGSKYVKRRWGSSHLVAEQLA